MSLNPAYGPQNETSTEVLIQKTFIQAGYLVCLGNGEYFLSRLLHCIHCTHSLEPGLQLMLYIACMNALLNRRPGTQRSLLCLYTTSLCFINTLWMSTSLYGLQATFLNFRNYPRGPFGFILVENCYTLVEERKQMHRILT